MVKADYKRDYYADLEVPNTADAETIKKRFRELAKQYHPDRNPGHEVDVVPKFQAIQAAHEVLGDPIQKAKYDLERAKLNRPRDVESPTFRKPPPPRRTDSGYQNGAFQPPNPQGPPRRDASANNYGPQNAPRPRPQQAATSTADRFAQFARAAPPQWNRSNFEEAARAEGLRGMNAMRGGPVPQTSPLRTRQHPTAPKPAGDPYGSSTDPLPGFQGLNRANSQRRFPSANTGGEETRSAYAHYHRADRERPPSAGSFPNVVPERSRESVSPLRQTRSFPHHDELPQTRPPLSRTSSRYARTGGERTNLNTTPIGRSASVRNSPIDREWEERGPFGAKPVPEERNTRPRHRSHSPQTRPGNAKFEYNSETSSDEDAIPSPQERRKAPLKRPQTHTSTYSSDGPGLTGYFPNTNYTRIVEDGNKYDYPAPESKGTPIRKPFANLASAFDAHDPNANEPPFRSSSEEDISRHNSHPDQRGSSKVDTPWNPDEWHEHFDNHADLFKPPVPNSRDRKSPSKGFRTSRSGQGRPYAETKRDAATDDVDPGIIGGFRNIDPNSSQSKSSAFQAGKLAPNFLNQVNGSRRESKTATAEKPAETPGSDSVYSNGDRPTPDEMELDSPDLADTGSPGVSDATYNVTVEEERSPTSEQSNISPRQHIHRHHSDSAAQANGFNLSDLRQAGPFAPSKGGLEDVDALKDSIPFQSRPAEDLEALRRTNSSTFRELKLPRPPKCPTCPAELNQKSWGRYGDAMTIYMHDWNKFNAAMIEHFKARQEAVTHGMWRNWVCAQGDGATAEDFDKSNGSDRAGYQTYMTWLDDDRKCRTWWDVAFEEHRVCMEALGQVRKKVKELNARGSG